MYTRTKLPKGFKPYKKIMLGNSTVESPGVLIEDGGFGLLLIGSGGKVWIYKPARAEGKITLTPVVENSVSKDELCQVEADKNSINITYNGVVILSLSLDKDVASILSLDYRPLGLTLYSVPDGYAIYGITMANFTIEGGSNQLMCCLN